MRTLLLTLCLLVIPATATCEKTATAAEIANYIRYSYLGGYNYQKKIWNAAPRIGHLIVLNANIWRVDPLDLTIIVESESSYREGNITGAIGEVGLTQLHGLSAKGVDLKTSTGQIWGGARWLRKCLDLCKDDLYQTLQAYQTGSCLGKAKGPRIRVRRIWRANEFVRLNRPILDPNSSQALCQKTIELGLLRMNTFCQPEL